MVEKTTKDIRTYFKIAQINLKKTQLESSLMCGGTKGNVSVVLWHLEVGDRETVLPFAVLDLVVEGQVPVVSSVDQSGSGLAVSWVVEASSGTTSNFVSLTIVVLVVRSLTVTSHQGDNWENTALFGVTVGVEEQTQTLEVILSTENWTLFQLVLGDK
ncbi:hypothetical protein WICPIJ_004079 [Wickerhamomyces pijperi]|uniref:Uncharacterized protein n=1 Tax=Wickerhamomyces pijperi TaxID=599730 RepID=A0A9P8Q5Y3_WICPI|nr:hypothetical protein WICPIJ_004079 [Wickerhamomyces pijperi]